MRGFFVKLKNSSNSSGYGGASQSQQWTHQTPWSGSGSSLCGRSVDRSPDRRPGPGQSLHGSRELPKEGLAPRRTLQYHRAHSALDQIHRSARDWTLPGHALASVTSMDVIRRPDRRPSHSSAIKPANSLHFVTSMEVVASQHLAIFYVRGRDCVTSRERCEGRSGDRRRVATLSLPRRRSSIRLGTSGFDTSLPGVEERRSDRDRRSLRWLRERSGHRAARRSPGIPGIGSGPAWPFAATEP